MSAPGHNQWSGPRLPESDQARFNADLDRLVASDATVAQLGADIVATAQEIDTIRAAIDRNRALIPILRAQIKSLNGAEHRVRNTVRILEARKRNRRHDLARRLAADYWAQARKKFGRAFREKYQKPKFEPAQADVVNPYPDVAVPENL